MPKTVDSATRQLQLSLEEEENRFRDHLRDGDFTVTYEFEPPPLEQPFEVGLLPVGETLEALKGQQFDGIVLRGGADRHPLHRMVEYVRKTKRTRRDVTAMIALDGRSIATFRSDVAALISAGVQTVVAGTGAAQANHPRDRNGKPLCQPDLYLDSCRMIRLLQEENPQLLIGACTNPYKYTVADSWLQHLKMLRKLNTGASFLVTEAGWDMKKLQELQWFMASRDLSEPVVARLRFVEQKSIMDLLDQANSGVVLPQALAARLERDAGKDERHARLAQISRMALQAVGCRLLGYSGVQISGLTDAELAPLLLRRIRDGLQEFTDYNLWLAAWKDACGQLDMTPHPHRYYLYRDLLEPDKATWDGETARPHPATLDAPSGIDKLRCNLGAALGLGANPSPLKRPVCGALSAPDQDVSQTLYLGAAECPKGLTAGPCGGSRVDGSCEFGDRPCFFHRVLALAQWRGAVDELETGIDDSGF